MVFVKMTSNPSINPNNSSATSYWQVKAYQGDESFYRSHHMCSRGKEAEKENDKQEMPLDKSPIIWSLQHL